MVEKNIFSIPSIINQPSGINCIKVLEDSTYEKPKFVVSFNQFMYIVDHTG